MCDKVGWDEGIKSLNAIIAANENAHAYLIAGTHKEQQEAIKLNSTITLQKMSVLKLKEYRKSHR